MWKRALLGAVTMGTMAWANEPTAEAPAAAEPTQVAAEVVPAPTPPPPAPYSTPWQLRPAAPASVVRSDTSVAFMRNANGDPGSTVATMLLLSQKVRPDLAPFVRVGFVGNTPPVGGQNGGSFVNPLVGAIYGTKLSDTVRFAASLAFAIPIGMGGGDNPDPATVAAARSGVLARSAMDNAMFAVNDFVVIPGVDIAYVSNGFTAQLEATVLQLTRVKGAAVQPDASKTNFTSGLHVGYFVHPKVSIAAELRYQRWLSTPAAVTSELLRDNLTIAAGPRMHFKLSDKMWIRPGLSYSRGLDRPMSTQSYDIVQLDVPFFF